MREEKEGSTHSEKHIQLAQDVVITVVYDETQLKWLVSDQRFEIRASGGTEAEAIAAFRSVFSQSFDVLDQYESNLDAPTREMFLYLREHVDAVTKEA